MHARASAGESNAFVARQEAIDFRGARALDEERGLLFAGCDEGKATAMDLRKGGKVVDTANTV